MRARDAVITGHSRTSPVRRGLFAIVTAVAWTGFGWLILPAITALLWLVGFSVAYDATVANLRSIDGRLLRGVIVAALLLGSLLVGWAEVQRRRFSGVERRERARDTAVCEVGEALGATPEITERLRAWRIVVIAMREDGTPADVRHQDPAGPAGEEPPSIPTQRHGDAADVVRADARS